MSLRREKASVFPQAWRPLRSKDRRRRHPSQEPELTVSSDANKANAQAFYDLMFNKCQPREAIESYADAVYIQHNPHVADGKAAFIDYFERMAREYPGKSVHFKRAIAEGNFVVLHCHQIWPGSKHRLRRHRHFSI
jgi:predicted SnoaL-like aldol condensation-catalyzing enzyme